MQPGRLSVKQVEKIVRERKPGYTADGGGLYLQISRYGTPSWVFRYRLGTELNAKGIPKLKEMGLGPCHTITLAKAREAAQRAREQLYAFRHAEDGALHPIADRRARQSKAKTEAAAVVTFRDAAEAYMAAHKDEWSNAVHARQWPQSLATYVYPVIGNVSVASINKALVLRVLEPIWTKKRDTAGRVRSRIERVLDWATAAEHRQGDNPAKWKGNLENLLAKPGKKANHHAALPFSEIGTFMAELREYDSVSARALEFTILTCARTAEVLGMRWSEVDFAERTWTIPPERMKSRKEHRVPLSDAAMAVLEKMDAIRSSDFVFPGERPGQQLWATTMIETLRRMGHNHTVHGFRSTFRDWVGDRSRFPEVLAELALAHAVGDKTERAYRRGTGFEKRRQLAQAWAGYCATPPSETAAIVSIRGKAG